MTVSLFDLDSARYVNHELHRAERCWSETNCYLDVWIEVLHSLAVPPEACGACAFSADFEGSQWVFLKFPPEDLRFLYGIEVHELNVWRPLVEHLEEQLGLGHLLTVEVDSFFLPDTRGVAYRERHQKTTIVPQLLDQRARRLGYFHSAGYFELEGEDYDGALGFGGLGGEGLPPYVEIVRLEGLERDRALLGRRAAELLASHLARRPTENPVSRLKDRILADLPQLQTAGLEFFHDYAFGTLRQCGSTAEIAADFCSYLAGVQHDDLDVAIAALRRVAEIAKAAEFSLARAVCGRRADPGELLSQMESDWALALGFLVQANG